MVSIDRALVDRESKGQPIRVALIGAGAEGRMIARQLLTPIPGVRLVAIANRTPERAVRAFECGGITDVRHVTSASALEECVSVNQPAIVEDARVACEAGNIDAIIEATGTVEHGARIAMAAFERGKHVVLVNVELDSTVGPILKAYADRAGVIVTNTDGDEPGVAMTLLRYLRSIGIRPVAAGNLKGFIDRYRTPSTQSEFAARHDQNAAKVTSFADGTKLSMEATVLANATGFGVARRGMYGPACAHVRDLPSLLPADSLLGGGIVDYALGADPYTGAFVIGYESDAFKRRDFAYFKMGDGPFFVFYTPYHLPHVQIVSTLARAVLHADATVTPIGGPVCEVAAIAKRDLAAGEVLDGVGGFMCYGLIENIDTFRADGLLPIGLAEECCLLRDVPKDAVIRHADVVPPKGRLSDRLHVEQVERFRPVRTSGVTHV